MAIRKKKAKAKKAAKPTAGRVNEDGHLCFEKLDLLRYELARHRVVNDSQAIRLKKAEIDAAKRELAQAIQRLSTEVTALKMSQREREKELKALQDELGGSYGIDLSKMSYDDMTGRIYLDGEPVVRG